MAVWLRKYNLSDMGISWMLLLKHWGILPRTYQTARSKIMGRISEKVFVGEIPDGFRINFDEMPKHEMDAFCRCFYRMAIDAFKDPEVVAYHEKRLAEKKDSLERRTAAKGKILKTKIKDVNNVFNDN